MLQTVRGEGDFTPSLDPSHHISMFAFSNTVSRLAAGVISDYVSSSHRARPSSRIPLLLALSICQVFALFVLAYSPVSWLREWFSVGSVLIGVSYGGIFTLAPTVVSVVWGIGGFGRNWGILTFTPGTFDNFHVINGSSRCDHFWSPLRASLRHSFTATSSHL